MCSGRSNYGLLKMAPTVWFELVMVIVHAVAETGVQLLDQPPNDPALGAAVRVTVVPTAKVPVHPTPGPALCCVDEGPVYEQLMLPGELVTVPVPTPAP